MTDDAKDSALDSALSALYGSISTDAVDDERFAKRIAAGLSNFAPTSRRELETVLAAPFPDDHHDRSDEDFAREGARGDDHDAASAADFGDVRGWEGSMSEDDRPPNSLAALSGLTRSGATSRNPDAIEGAAKGDDSGLIDLRAMSQPEAAPAAEAAPPADDSGAISIREMKKPAEKAAAPVKSSEATGAPVVAAAAPAAAPAPVAAVAAAPAAPKEKKKGAGLWIALGGLAAAAAVAAVVIPMTRKADEAPAASNQSAPADNKAEEKKDKVAVAPAASAAPTAEAPAASASAAEPDPAATVAVAPTAYGGSTPKAMQAAPGGAMPIKADKPDPKAPAAPPAPSNDPIKKPAGGSLDDVLGIGKGNEPAAKKEDPNANLPDKPDSMDVRSAINGKVGAARACVKGQTEASSVSVTFGPGGGVSAVVVTSGEAKGTGAEACIKGAFSSAKVPP